MDIKNMSLKEKIGQLLVVGFPGKELTNKDKDHIKKYYLGNVIYFTHNLGKKDEIIELGKAVQDTIISATGIPAFITIDQEGGMVTRIYNGGTFFPGAMAFAALDDKHTGYIQGKYMAKELLNLGINFNLAPVLDVNNNSKNPVIGVRSYGQDPDKVADLAEEYIKGLQSENVIGTAKHFPGHGDTKVDSHFSMPAITHDLERLNKIELVPFKRAIKANVSAIMSAHILFKNLTDDGLPATLSYQILTELLREKLGFKGLIITDCMEMKAIADGVGTAQGAVKAIEAGADLICISHSMSKQAEAFEAIYERVKSGCLSEERIDESVRRILAIKEQYKLGNFKENINKLKKEEIMTHKEFAKQISRKSVTLIKGEKDDMYKPGEKVLVISPKPISLNDADSGLGQQAFAKTLADQIGGDYEIIDLTVKEDQINEIVSKAKEYNRIIIGTYNATNFTTQADLVNKIYNENPNIIGVALRNPYDIEMYKRIPVFITAYEYSLLSITNLVEAITTDYKYQGKLPVKISI